MVNEFVSGAVAAHLVYLIVGAMLWFIRSPELTMPICAGFFICGRIYEIFDETYYGTWKIFKPKLSLYYLRCAVIVISQLVTIVVCRQFEYWQVLLVLPVLPLVLVKKAIWRRNNNDLLSYKLTVFTEIVGAAQSMTNCKADKIGMLKSVLRIFKLEILGLAGNSEFALLYDRQGFGRNIEKVNDGILSSSSRLISDPDLAADAIMKLISITRRYLEQNITQA